MHNLKHIDVDIPLNQIVGIAGVSGSGKSSLALGEATPSLSGGESQRMKLVSNGATVIVIEHHLDVIRSADYIIDMGPGGGEAGGQIVAVGTPEQIAGNRDSITGKFL